MSKGKITDKQREILEYIKETILAKGYPPAVREICEAVHLKSTSSVHSHLETLEKNGYIRRDPTKPRTIEILDDDFALTRREMVQVPIIGTVAAGMPILAEENIENYFPVPAERNHQSDPAPDRAVHVQSHSERDHRSQHRNRWPYGGFRPWYHGP